MEESDTAREAPKAPRLLEQLRDAINRLHYSQRTASMRLIDAEWQGALSNVRRLCRVRARHDPFSSTSLRGSKRITRAPDKITSSAASFAGTAVRLHVSLPSTSSRRSGTSGGMRQ